MLNIEEFYNIKRCLQRFKLFMPRLQRHPPYFQVLKYSLRYICDNIYFAPYNPNQKKKYQFFFLSFKPFLRIIIIYYYFKDVENFCLCCSKNSICKENSLNSVHFILFHIMIPLSSYIFLRQMQDLWRGQSRVGVRALGRHESLPGRGRESYPGKCLKIKTARDAFLGILERFM